MTTTDLRGGQDLSQHGLTPTGRVIWHPTTALLYEHALVRGDGRLAEGGPLVVDTGKHTGRSPKDKFVVREPGSEGRIWWDGNNEIGEDGFELLRAKIVAHLERAQVLYVVDSLAGADPKHGIAVRVVTDHPYHALFAKTLFIDPTDAEREGFSPDALVLHAPEVVGEPGVDGTRTETFVVLHPARTELLVGGTFYAGEIKKSIFTVLNDRLPLEGVLPMHCSANVSRDGDNVAIFFGLSGTGKTTLSAEPSRMLIGDDEHGWGDNGVFNFEGGCYAKTIRLSPTAEPEIWKASHSLRDDPRERRDRRAGRDRPRRRLEDREHARRVQARGDRQRAAREDGRAPALRRLPHRRRVRDPAADRAAHARPGALLLPLRLHLEARRHRDRDQRAAADVLDLLRLAVPAAGADGLLADARREDRRARLGGVARQHRLDRRPVRRRRADADRRDAGAARRRALRRARPRRVPHGGAVRLRGAGRGAGRRLVPARPALDVGRPGGVRPEGARAGRDVPHRTSRRSSPRTPRRPSSPPGRASSRNCGRLPTHRSATFR